jgi:phosphoribosylformylglycinamidine synthase
MFPGTNCEQETARALRAAGAEADVFHWNSPVEQLSRYHGIVIPGGFSYEDRVRAGAIVARESLMDVVESKADQGWPVLGICNGAQVLVERGLVPRLGVQSVEAALAPNRVPGFYCGWVRLVVDSPPDRSAFTRGMKQGEILPMPVAHAEGRFVSSLPRIHESLSDARRVVFKYCDRDGNPTERFPDNPNGSAGGVAGLCNGEGNVLAMMPHPERCSWWRQLPDGARKGSVARSVDAWRAPAPGRRVFGSMVDYIQEKVSNGSVSAG